MGETFDQQMARLETELIAELHMQAQGRSIVGQFGPQKESIQGTVLGVMRTGPAPFPNSWIALVWLGGEQFVDVPLSSILSDLQSIIRKYFEAGQSLHKWNE